MITANLTEADRQTAFAMMTRITDCIGRNSVIIKEMRDAIESHPFDWEQASIFAPSFAELAKIIHGKKKQLAEFLASHNQPESDSTTHCSFPV